MSNEQLKSTLKALRHNLESAGDSVDAELKSLLQALDTDIHQLLQTAPATSEVSGIEDDALASRAQQLAARLAAQHPQLEGALRELGITLGRMGI